MARTPSRGLASMSALLTTTALALLLVAPLPSRAFQPGPWYTGRATRYGGPGGCSNRASAHWVLESRWPPSPPLVATANCRYPQRQAQQMGPGWSRAECWVTAAAAAAPSAGWPQLRSMLAAAVGLPARQLQRPAWTNSPGALSHARCTQHAAGLAGQRAGLPHLPAHAPHPCHACPCLPAFACVLFLPACPPAPQATAGPSTKGERRAGRSVWCENWCCSQ